ncbi:chitooligosaccharide deacetylase [Bacillus sp. MUM 116]|uniref:polysaccharide deacetylase family protein n=1 Tax=Bacillus sp. MUM 116 TaxID=1678002 RepID=UPI0008F58021|nr:polysaccharide deacetylase family protein [Bacillus sp. MUM 116]OIK10329.1 chitooligosaccharide deacetylase [Bacillus sp. MUM 116]
MKKILFITFFLLMPLFSFEINASASTTQRFKFEKTGQAFWEVKTKEKLVALTFDDGPHPFFTPKILDILEKYHAKATFFVTGLKAEQYPDLIKREFAEGHEIANHTYNHHFQDNLNPRILSDEIKKADKAIKRITGVTPSLFRPVGGYYNDSVIKTAVQNQKTVIIWTWGQDSRDWKNPPVSQICDSVLKGVKPGNIILFHDWHGDQFSKKCSTTKALETILEDLKNHGYKCVTMSELLYRTSKMIPDKYHIYP